MEKPGGEAPVSANEDKAPKRPKPSWYHYIIGFFGGWILVIPLVLMRYVEFTPGVRLAFLSVAFPILMGGTWWVINRGDRYLDEFELATTREMESIAFRLTVAAIIALELLYLAGVDWDQSFIITFGLLWNYAGIRVNRRIKKRMKASAKA